MSGSEDGIEGVIRLVVREELERAASSRSSRDEPGDRKLLYSVADVAVVTGMSAQNVRNHIRAGRLAAAQPSGTKWLVEREEVTRYAAWLRAGRPD